MGIGAYVQKTSFGATGPRKMFDDIFSRLEYTNVEDIENVTIR